METDVDAIVELSRRRSFYGMPLNRVRSLPSMSRRSKTNLQDRASIEVLDKRLEPRFMLRSRNLLMDGTAYDPSVRDLTSIGTDRLCQQKTGDNR